ncbi:hypothetical protein [Maribacter sp. 2304DJ31-5]|uniref:hypothetical protein n=1 Tax=Maribacter sp. 2304DJ31-5 TaxID=3386273 RepID=UPI0039BC8F2D
MKKIILWIGLIGINITLNAQETVQGINFHAEHASYNSSGVHDSHLTQWDRLSLALKSENNSFRIEDWTLGSSNVKTIFSANADGMVGINTSSPKEKFHVKGNILIDSYSLGNDNGIFFRENFSSGNKYNMSILTYDHSNSGTSPDGLSFNAFDGLSFSTGSNNRNERMRIDKNGNVGIGTTNPGSWKLAVNGSIRAKEIKVETGWSDFVFFSDYKLSTLEEVENHIKEKGHLKDIPSAKEVTENGIYLGEMDSKLLQKIEELTLYTIQQEKKIKKLEKENQELKSLSNRLSKIEKLLLESKK